MPAPKPVKTVETETYEQASIAAEHHFVVQSITTSFRPPAHWETSAEWKQYLSDWGRAFNESLHKGFGERLKNHTLTNGEATTEGPPLLPSLATT